jgi:hypothetical protein
LAKEEELYRTGFFGPDLGHLVGEDQAGYPLYFGMNPSFVLVPNNGVSFPMTKLLPVANLCWSVPIETRWRIKYSPGFWSFCADLGSSRTRIWILT